MGGAWFLLLGATSHSIRYKKLQCYTMMVVSVCGAGGPCSKITNWSWKSSFGPSVFVTTIKTIHSLAVEITRGRTKRDASVVHATIVVVWVLLNLLFVSCCSTNEQGGCSHCCCLGETVVVVLVVVGIIVVQSSDCVAIAPFPHKPGVSTSVGRAPCVAWFMVSCGQ